MLTIELRLFSIFWARGPISFKHMSWYPFFEPHETTHHSNIGVRLLLHWIWHLVSPILIVLLNTNCGIVSLTLNVNPTLFVIPYNFGGIIILECCNSCHLPSGFSSKFQSSMTIFHHKLMRREGRVVTNGWTHPSSMIVYFHLFIISVIHKAIVMT